MYDKKQVLFTMGVTLFSSALFASTKPKNVAAADVAVPQTVDVVNDSATSIVPATTTPTNADSDTAVQAKSSTDVATTSAQPTATPDTASTPSASQTVPAQSQVASTTVAPTATPQTPANNSSNATDNGDQTSVDLNTAKQTTIGNLKTQAGDAKSIINQQADLTTDKKTGYVADIDNIVSEASTSVEQINDQAELTELETQFSLYILQTQAQAQLEQGYVSLSKKHPDQATNLEAVWANNSDLLGSATTNEAAQNVLTAGLQALNDVISNPDLASSRQDILSQLQEAHDGMISKIQDSSLPSDAQDDFMARVDDAYNAAAAIIQSATTVDDMKSALATGKKNITNVLGHNGADDLNTAYNTAINDLNTVYHQALDALDQLTLNEAHQKQLNQQIMTAYKDAFTNIFQAAPADISTAKDQGITGLKQIIATLNSNHYDDSFELAQTSALTQLQDEHNAMIDKIKNSDLSSDAKDDFLARANNAYSIAVANVQSATTTNDVQSALTTGKQNITNVLGHNGADDLTDAKNSAFNELNELRDRALKILDQSNMATSDKNTLKEAIMGAYTDAYTKIVITNMDGIAGAKEAGVANINKIITQINSSSTDNNLEVVKNDAINALQTARDHDLATVSALNPQVTRDLTSDDVNQFTTQINAAFDTAVNAINSATSEADVAAAKTAGINAMNQVADNAISENNLNTANQSTQEVLDAINSAANTLIDQANISSEDKASFKDQLAGFYSTATTNLANATSLAAMTAIKDNFVTQTNQLIASVAAKTLSTDTNGTAEETSTTDSTDSAIADPSTDNGIGFAAGADPAMVSHLISDPAQVGDPQDPKASLPQLGEQNNTGWIGWLLLDSVIAMFGFGKSKKRRN